LGYEVEYEKEIADNLTPDWFVLSKNDIPPFAVEVFTANPPKEFEAEWKGWRYLRGALEELPGNAIISISRPYRNNVPTYEENKKIMRSVKQWLLDKPNRGSKKDIDGIVIELRDYKEELQKIEIWGPAISMIIDSNRLKVNIHKNKAKKYKVLKDAGIPLVIAIVPMITSGFSTFSLENVLLGHEAIKIDVDGISGEPVLGDTVRRNNGLFNGISPTDAALSTVLWIPKKLNQPLPLKDIKVYRNPSASLPLPLETFKFI
jgi:hypothetical protein